MPSISIKHELKLLEKNLKGVEKQAISKALPPALNKIRATTESAAIREVSKQTKIKQKDIRKTVKPKAFIASRAKPFAVIDFTDSRATNLINFVASSKRNPHVFRKRTRKGFKFKGVVANAWGVRKEYDGAFIGKGRRSGKTLVFKRVGRKLSSVAGPSPRLTFQKQSVKTVMTNKIRERLPIELNRSVARELRKFRR